MALTTKNWIIDVWQGSKYTSDLTFIIMEIYYYGDLWLWRFIVMEIYYYEELIQQILGKTHFLNIFFSECLAILSSRRPGSLLNVWYTFNLRPVSTGYVFFLGFFWEFSTIFRLTILYEISKERCLICDKWSRYPVSYKAFEFNIIYLSL